VTERQRIPPLTATELEAVIAVAGNAQAWETFDGEGEAYQEKMNAAYERGMDKLRAMLARREAAKGT